MKNLLIAGLFTLIFVAGYKANSVTHPSYSVVLHRGSLIKDADSGGEIKGVSIMPWAGNAVMIER